MHIKSDLVKLYPGAVRLFEELKTAKIRIGLGTNGSRASVEKLTAKLGIKRYFESIVTFEDAPHPKPSPDIFLQNAQNMKCLPGECIVVEDSTEGLSAAIAAGMKVIALSTTLKKKELKHADMILKTINDINLSVIHWLA